MFSIFHFRLKVQLQKNNRCRRSSTFFQDVLRITAPKISNLSIFFVKREEWTHANKKIPKKDRDAVCGSNNIPLQHFFFPIPLIILAPLSRSLPVVTQIRGHIAGPPPPSPLRHVPSFLSREEFSIFFPRVDSRRIVPTYAARRSQQLNPFFFHSANKVKSHHGGNRTQEQTNVSSVRG